MAYDAITGNVVLFGGLTPPVDPPICFNDIWAWDGTTWTQQSPTTNPPRRQLAGMTYDGPPAPWFCSAVAALPVPC